VSDSRSNLYHNIKRCRERGKYGAKFFSRKISEHVNWCVRIPAVSGAGRPPSSSEHVDRTNVFPDIEAFNNVLGIYLAGEIKTTKSNRIYVRNKLRRRKDGSLPPIPKELVQVRKLFESMNVVANYPRRYAFLGCKFRKQVRVLILREWHCHLPFIAVTPTTKGAFRSVSDFIRFVEQDTRVWFPLNPSFLHLVLNREKNHLPTRSENIRFTP